MLDIESHKIAYSSTLAFNLMVQLEVALAEQSEFGRAQAGKRQQQGQGVRPIYMSLNLIGISGLRLIRVIRREAAKKP